MGDGTRAPDHYCLGSNYPRCLGSWRFLRVCIRIQYILLSTCNRKRKAPPPDTTTGVQLADASGRRGVCARAVKHKSSDTSEREAPPPDTTSGVQLADASNLKGIYARAIKDKSSGTIRGYKYEPRFTPPRVAVDDSTTRRFNRLSLGEYHTRDEAKIMLQIAHFYYDKDQGCVQLDDGQFKFFIPPMNEQERRLAGEEKRKWVTAKAKQVYADLGIQRQNLKQLSLVNRISARSSHDKHIGVSEVPSVSSANALEVPSCPAPLLPCDVADALEVPSCPAPLPLCDVADALEVPSYPTPLLPCDVADALEVPSCRAPLPPCDVANGYCDIFSGFGNAIDELLCPDSPNFLPQQSSLNCEMHFVGLGQIFGGPSPPQADGVTQSIQGSIDAPLSPHVDFQQGWDLVGASGSNFFAEPRDPVLQQLVHHQKQQLEVYALRIVGLEHQLSEYQIQNSVLHQEIERLRTSQLSNGSLSEFMSFI